MIIMNVICLVKHDMSCGCQGNIPRMTSPVRDSLCSYLKCGWWLGRLGARWRGITIPSLLPSPTIPPPSKFEGKVLGFLTSLTERITSWNCCVLSASFWAIRAILSLNFLGLLPAMSSLGVHSTARLKSQQKWELFYWIFCVHNRCGDCCFITAQEIEIRISILWSFIFFC